MEAGVLNSYASRIESDLVSNILPFWIERAVDQERGGFFGAMTNDLRVQRRAERGALLTSRILWTYSAAYRRFKDASCLAMAEHAYRDLVQRFFDRDHGGFFWSVVPNKSVRQSRKQTYGQAFAIYALAEFHRASGQREALHLAIATSQLIETHAREPLHGGYLEARGRDWTPIDDMRLSPVDMNEPKSQNTLLHMMEAYSSLLRVWPNDHLHEAQRSLVNLMLDRVLDPATNHLRLFFANDWTPRSDGISYGHDIEAAWLLVDAAETLEDSDLIACTRELAIEIARVTLAEGVDADGGVFNFGTARGLTDPRKEWWPQAEAMVGFLCAAQLSGDERLLEAALRSWDFIEQHLIDREHGEWIRGVTRERQPLADELKISFWKCPYHNGRAALEATTRLRALAGASEAMVAPVRHKKGGALALARQRR
jgi:mannobiose 2-epimerase